METYELLMPARKCTVLTDPESEMGFFAVSPWVSSAICINSAAIVPVFSFSVQEVSAGER